MVHNGSLGATPDLLIFQTVQVCCDCGYSTFTLEHNELLKLKEARIARPETVAAASINCE